MDKGMHDLIKVQSNLKNKTGGGPWGPCQMVCALVFVHPPTCVSYSLSIHIFARLMSLSFCIFTHSQLCFAVIKLKISFDDRNWPQKQRKIWMAITTQCRWVDRCGEYLVATLQSWLHGMCANIRVYKIYVAPHHSHLLSPSRAPLLLSLFHYLLIFFNLENVESFAAPIPSWVCCTFTFSIVRCLFWRKGDKNPDRLDVIGWQKSWRESYLLDYVCQIFSETETTTRWFSVLVQEKTAMSGDCSPDRFFGRIYTGKQAVDY